MEKSDMLTPEEVEAQVSKLWDHWLDSKIEPEEVKKTAIDLITKYGAQQEALGFGRGFKRAEKESEMQDARSFLSSRHIPGDSLKFDDTF